MKNSLMLSAAIAFAAVTMPPGLACNDAACKEGACHKKAASSTRVQPQQKATETKVTANAAVTAKPAAAK
jgi:hypothetical protein